MTELEQIRTAGGNTETPAKKGKQNAQYQYWSFTYNNYGKIEQIEQIEQIFKHECKWYVFQEETGSEGTPHLQGTICLLKRKRLSELKKIDTKIHWEATKSVSASIVYCSKLESRTGKIYTHGINIPKPLEVDEPYGWQLEIMDIIKQKPDKRTIHWFWEDQGGVGKSSLCKYLGIRHNALMLSGKTNDMFHLINKCEDRREIIIIDIPRSIQDFVNYGAIESIKNGAICSGKYEGCVLYFNCPHVICFANEPPDLTKMSADRWNIRNIKV